jgi:hypothetical protein
MLRGSHSRFLRSFISFVLAAIVASVPIATAVANSWELGSRPFSTTGSSAAAPLQLRAGGPAGLRSFAFVGRVGGVAFEAVAKPGPEMAGKSIALTYDPARPDGLRLVVRVGASTLRANVPDWQLRPIAIFADSEYTATLSLFGEGPEPDRYYYIQYHDALKDTLLGMRILQADILFFSLDEHWRLPKYDGQIFLGRGESNANEDQSVRAAETRIASAFKGKKFQSWVLTDAGTQPTIGTADGTLVISAKPYYYFWQIPEGQAHDRLVGEYNSLLESYKKDVERYNSLVDTYNRAKDASSQQALQGTVDGLKAKIDAQVSRLEALKSRVENPEVKEVAGLTNAMRSLDKALSDYNPAVYSSYQRLAQFASFFRYVKQNNPANWRSFQQTIRAVAIAPSVSTPTTWEKDAH